MTQPAWGYPVFGKTDESADVAVGADPTFTNLAGLLTLQGSQFLVLAFASGLAGGANTPRLQVLVDGAPSPFCTFFGPGANAASGEACAVIAMAFGASGPHTFQMQGSQSGGSWTIHGGSNPGREGAWLVVIPLAP